MKKILMVLAVIVVLTSVLGAVGCAKAPEGYHWKVAHIRPIDTDIDKDVHWFVDKINQDSGGRIVIDIYPAQQLGDYEVVQERCGLGDIEMQVACVGTKLDKRLMIQSLPYLAKDWDEARVLYTTGSFLIDIVDELLADQNLKFLGGWPCYFGGIALTKEPPSPGDPDVPKNIKIRVPPQKGFELMAEELGFIATPLPFAEMVPALQTGIVEGSIGAGAEGYYAMIRDLMKYYLPLNDHFEMWYAYMSLDLWNSLSDEDREIVLNAGRALEERRFAVAEDRQHYNEQRLRDYGIEVVEFTDAELEGFTQKIRENVWPQLRDDIGPEVVDKVVAALG